MQKGTRAPSVLMPDAVSWRYTVVGAVFLSGRLLNASRRRSAMAPLQPLRSFASLLLSICLLLSPLVTKAKDASWASLPPVEVLEKARYEPVPPPNLAGVPTYEDLVDVLNSFGSYLRGSAITAKYEEPVLTRGAAGVSLFRRVSPAVVLVVAAKFVGDQVSDMSEGTGVIVDRKSVV